MGRRLGEGKLEIKRGKEKGKGREEEEKIIMALEQTGNRENVVQLVETQEPIVLLNRRFASSAGGKPSRVEERAFLSWNDLARRRRRSSNSYFRQSCENLLFLKIFNPYEWII